MITRMLSLLFFSAVIFQRCFINNHSYRLIKQRFAVLLITLLAFSPAYSQAEEAYTGFDRVKVDYPAQNTLLIILGSVSAGVLFSGVGYDKKLHFSGSVILGAGSEYVLRKLNDKPFNRWQRVAAATGMGLVPGVIKEVTDSKFDAGDLLADVTGSFVGALASDLLQGPITQAQPLVSFSLGKDHVGLSLSQPF